MRIAVNLLLQVTGYPATTPGLTKVLQAVGLPGDKRVLHAQHPLVVGQPEGAFVLCPVETNSSSSLLATSILHTQFTNMLDKSCLLIQFIGKHLIFKS